MSHGRLALSSAKSCVRRYTECQPWQQTNSDKPLAEGFGYGFGFGMDLKFRIDVFQMK
jgi:hypothetical protein